jgi:uncharacterized membrane protein
MAQIIESIDVGVPVRVAYDQWTQFESFPQFLSFVDSIEQIDDTLTHWRVTIGGVTREFDARITEQHPDERVAWTSVGGEVEQGGVVTFHRLGESSSRVTVQIDWEPGNLVEKVGSAVGVDDFAIKHDLEHFKEVVEAADTPPAGWRGDLDTP